MIELEKDAYRCPKDDCRGILIKIIGNRQTFGQQMKMQFRCSACGSYYEKSLVNKSENIE
ncbi:MAG: hypothetical protein CEN91_29 [Candidatus Berkelbacteria bacterium Licking1014_85]|uniref:Uncharacterized protein n=1 Tax=Candidatus Berkelbacteria bacterium Licking1014_85 TaxID=2017148 RepID=A0A554LMK7_9BACT|nr:MAG: hypothetical protein CEN91_29 [Candidatus Berkelbacteria bacterium Licking1014_85]